MNFDIDLAKALSHLGHLVVAYLLALPIGWNREARARSAGVRTFPLVAVASTSWPARAPSPGSSTAS